MSDLHNQNKQAIEQGFREMNLRINTLADRLDKACSTISLLQQELLLVKQQSIADMAAKFGSGPTAP